MMTKEQFRLLKLAEECTEVGKRCAKQMAFGRDQHDEGYEPNHVRLRDEILDVFVVVMLLEYMDVIEPISYRDVLKQYREKRDKIYKMSDLAISLGQVEPSLIGAIPEL